MRVPQYAADCCRGSRLSMVWWGKLAGAALGFAMGGFLGAVIGAVVGHQFDRGLVDQLSDSTDRRRRSMPHPDEDVFFDTTFGVMGHLAKADGRVSEDEIRAARSVMREMNLSDRRVREAIDRFTAGKQPDFPLDDTIARFRTAYFPRTDLYRAFVEIQLVAALADGSMHPNVRQVLWHVARKLGFGRVELAQMEALARARQWQGRAAPGVTRNTLGDAYRVLGIEADAPDAAVKKAYRRLMNRHHPDKLVAKGLPEDMMESARQRTREIRAAYEQVREARGMR